VVGEQHGLITAVDRPAYVVVTATADAARDSSLVTVPDPCATLPTYPGLTVNEPTIADCSGGRSDLLPFLEQRDQVFGRRCYPQQPECTWTLPDESGVMSFRRPRNRDNKACVGVRRQSSPAVRIVGDTTNRGSYTLSSNVNPASSNCPPVTSPSQSHGVCSEQCATYVLPGLADLLFRFASRCRRTTLRVTVSRRRIRRALSTGIGQTTISQAYLRLPPVARCCVHSFEQDVRHLYVAGGGNFTITIDP
jgi:hypothetical protein